MTTTTTRTQVDPAPVGVKPARPRRWTWWVAAASCLFVGLVMLASLSGGDKATDATPVADTGPAWYTVEPRTFDLTVLASGELDAKRRVEVKSMVEGATTIEEIIKEGEAVKAGDRLAKLADADILTKLETARIQLETAYTEHATAQQTVVIEQSEADSLIKAAQLKIDLAEIELSKWAHGTDPQERRELQLALEKAKRTLVRVKRDLELSEQLFKEKFISQGELEDDEIKVIEAEAELRTAELDIDVYENYTRPAEKREIESEIEQAKSELERTHRKTQSKVAQAEATLQGKAQTLHLREEAVKKLESQLAATVLIAPQDGLVVYSSTTAGRMRRGDPIAQGRQVRLSESIIVLPDISQMVAALKVHESMVTQVAVGQAVSVTVDARPSQVYEGTICEIGVMAEDGGWFNPELREYVVRVDLPTGDHGFKPAMRCKGRIKLGTVENALAVPVQAVFAEQNKHYCYVPAGADRVKRVPVTLGRASESFVEVKDGLQSGDRVLLRKPKPGEIQS
jgi:HlyD family secretion protein